MALPFNIPILLVATCALNAMIVQPSFGLAVAAQVLMGTVFVFSMQSDREMVAVYAHGSRAVYRLVAYRARLVYDCAVAVTNYAALAAYAYMGKKSAFVILAYATGVYACTFAVYFAVRMRPAMRASEAGAGGFNFARAEHGIRCRLEALEAAAAEAADAANTRAEIIMTAGGRHTAGVQLRNALSGLPSALAQVSKLHTGCGRTTENSAPQAKAEGRAANSPPTIDTDGALKVGHAFAAIAAPTAGGRNFGAIVAAMKHHPDHAVVQEKGCAALMNLAADDANRRAVGRVHGAFEAVVAAMQRHPDHAKVQQYGCRALMNLAVDGANRKAIGRVDGVFRTIVAALKRHRDHATTMCGCRALRRLSHNNDANRDAISSVPGSVAFLLANKNAR